MEGTGLVYFGGAGTGREKTKNKPEITPARE